MATAAMLPNLLFSLLVGNWVEGRDQRRIMVPADLVRAGLLATIPMAWAAGWLSLPWLVAVAFLTGVAGIFFEIAGFAYVPDLVARAELPAANRAVQGSSTVSEVAGPGLAGSGPGARPPTGHRRRCSVLCGQRGGGAERPSSAGSGCPRCDECPTKEPPTGWRQGLTILFTNVYLRALTIHAAAFNLAEQILVINLVLWAVQEQVSPGAYGLALSAAGLGALVGTLTALRLADRLDSAGLCGVPAAVLLRASRPGGITLQGTALAVVIGAVLFVWVSGWATPISTR